MTNETNTEKRAKMLEKVRLCLALANDPAATPGEAESARQRADHLMTAYSIAQWEADVAKPDADRPKPEVRNVNIDWWYDTKDRDSAYAIFSMFERVYRHCRCVVGYRGQSYRLMPVIGLASDLDWADQLFTSLMLQLTNNLIIRPDASKPLDANVYAMRMAGMSWPDITRRLWESGLVEAPRKPVALDRYEWVDLPDGTRDYRKITQTVVAGMPWREISEEAREAIKNPLANLNRAFARHNGFERNYVRPDVYQRSFTEGFCEEIRHRLFRMSDEFRRRFDNEHGTGSMALVVQDIYAQAVVLYDATFPPPPPVKPDPNAKPRKVRTVTIREKARSGAAARAGEAEAKKANLSNKFHRPLGRRVALASALGRGEGVATMNGRVIVFVLEPELNLDDEDFEPIEVFAVPGHWSDDDIQRYIAGRAAYDYAAVTNVKEVAES
jgi:hypothetical protein